MISLLQHKTATFPATATILRPPAAGRRLKACLSARVATDLIIGAYACALALLGALAAALLADGSSDGDPEQAFDPMVLGVVAAGFALICIGVFGINLRELQKFGASLRKTIGAFACALVVLSIVAWSSNMPPSHAQGAIWLWFLLGGAGLAALHGVVSRWLRESPRIKELCARRVAIVGGHDRTCARFLDLLLAQQDPDLRLVGVFQAGAVRARRPARPQPRGPRRSDPPRAGRRGVHRAALAGRAADLGAGRAPRRAAGRSQALSRSRRLRPGHGDRRAPCRRPGRDAAPPADPRLGAPRQADRRRRPRRNGARRCSRCRWR